MQIIELTKQGKNKGYFRTNLYSYQIRDFLVDYLYEKKSFDVNNLMDIADFIDYIRETNNEIYIEHFYVDDIFDIDIL